MMQVLRLYRLPSHPSHFQPHLLRAAKLFVITSLALAMAKVLASTTDLRLYTLSLMAVQLLPCLDPCQSSEF
jgi:hypothetical protein